MKTTSDRRAHSSTTRAAAGHLVEEGAALMQIAGHSEPGSGRPPRRATDRPERESFDVVVVGAGQAGLSVGYHLARRGLRFVILDAGERVGDPWRQRWDSLRLFTPARYDSLDGMPFPAPPHYYPTKDEMADYLESYADHFELPVRLRTRVRRLAKEGDRYVVTTADGHEIEADHVVVAMANYQRKKTPAFAADLAPGINQIHSADYRGPAQLREGGVLVVGAGNSGSEIAMELSRSHRVWLSGRHTGHLPFRIESFLGRRLFVPLVLRVIFHRILTIKTRLGKKLYPPITGQGGPLVRVKPKDLARAGVTWVPKTAGVENGLPRLEDGRVLDVANVVWCTGFHPGFSWIDLPILGDDGKPRHDGGVVPGEPGLYFVGLHFLYAVTSAMIHGAGRDARRIVDTIGARASASSIQRPPADVAA